MKTLRESSGGAQIWESYDLFIRDDEVDDFLLNTRNKGILTGEDMNSNNYEVILGYIKEIVNNFEKQFGKEYGKKSSSKKVEKLKIMLQIERKKNFWLMIALIVSYCFQTVNLIFNFIVSWMFVGHYNVVRLLYHGFNVMLYTEPNVFNVMIKVE
ncbi:unnamed protein product [Vicia faba]|uniref:Uncharacterized protein n=1 Tax=Vicia faba TaxID=3906 RepID=A0AAV1AKE4_VICFA|nr:unnamed protein product [Vicia faba]